VAGLGNAGATVVGRRRHRRALPVTVLLLVLLGAAGCSSSPTASPPTGSSDSSGSGSPTTGRSRPAVENLTISDAVRGQLVAALAAQIDVPVSEYTGLAPGFTYYALDRTTGTYWAGAKPAPAPSTDPNAPTRAQVASQDDGAYDVFDKPPGSAWIVHATGATGQGTVCAVTVPPAVLALWGWAPGSCRPADA
jgi:hypothetical protein